MFDAGDVVTVDFPGVTGVKRRPAVVVSSVIYHANRPDIIVGLITSQTARPPGPTDILLGDWVVAGLNVPSLFRAFLVTLPPAANPRKIGTLSERDFAAVCACIKTALTDLESPTTIP